MYESLDCLRCTMPLYQQTRTSKMGTPDKGNNNIASATVPDRYLL